MRFAVAILAVSLVAQNRNAVKGLKADGATDNAAAIQVAIASVCSAGGTLYFPGGVYVIETGLRVTSCRDVRFQGAPGAEIRFRAGFADTVYGAWPDYGKDSVIRIVGSSNITITGLTLNGNLSNRTAHATGESHNSVVLIAGSARVRIQNNILKEGMTDGVITVPAAGKNNADIWIENNEILNNRRNNVSGVGQIGMWIRRNKIAGAGTIQGTNPKAGIDIEPDSALGSSQNLHIEGNTVTGSAGDYAVVLTGLGTAGATIANNTVHGNAAYAFDFQAKAGYRNTGIALTRNTVYNHPKGCALRVVGPNLDKVAGNTFRDNLCGMVRFSPDGKNVPFTNPN